MPEPSQFRHYQIVKDADGNHVELVRNAEQVAVLAFDTQRLEFVHCHVLVKSLVNRAAFEETCRKIQCHGHPTIARMIEYGLDEGNPFYITSNIDGETLRAYLSRLTDMPGWLAVMLACRSLETAVALVERGDFLTDHPLESFRLVQTGAQTVQVLAADFRVLENDRTRKRALMAGFEKHAKFLKSFLLEQAAGNGMQPDHPVSAMNFMELLGACLSNAGPGVTIAMRELRHQLLKFSPDRLTSEIPAAQKPRALLAPLLASCQDVARSMVNIVRIQSQRLDLTNPYSMRGTLTKTGRDVLIEQVPPIRVCSEQVLFANQSAMAVMKKPAFTAFVTVPLLNETDDIVCLAEETTAGISLAALLKERRAIEPQEVSALLTPLDAALSQLDASSLPTAKLRLEDIFLITGYASEDPRCDRLLATKINDWPVFHVRLRAHPTLASMAGRGTDPAVLLPPTALKANTIWQGGWLAALTKLLIGIESPAGVRVEPVGHSDMRETISRLLDDEIAKVGEANPSTRADFLERYARVVQRHFPVKPPAEAPPPVIVQRIQSKPRTRVVSAPVHREAVSPLAGALTSGSSEASVETNSIGFAELLFRSSAVDPASSGTPDWAQAAAGAPPTLPEHLLPGDDVPQWLKVFVFIGGSMILGAFGAHLSGKALWLKNRGGIPRALETPAAFSGAKPAQKPAATPRLPELLPASGNVPLLPPDEPLTTTPGMSLSLPKEAAGLREQLSSEPRK
jgi:hypothetical protein